VGRHRDRELVRRLDRGRTGPAGQPRVSGAILIDAVGIEVEGHPVTDISGLSQQEIMALSFHDPGRYSPDPAGSASSTCRSR
jgi:hypothetical protein